MLRVVLIFSLLFSLIACSSTPGWKGVYSADSQEKQSYKLDVPPDLSEPNITDSHALPNIAGGSTYSAYASTEDTGDKITPANPAGVKVIRDGANQWLEINSTAEKLWPQLKVFFTKVGFKIKRDNKTLGIIETNYLENRLNLPSNWFSKMLSKVTSTGVRDKYRARLEKTDNPRVTRVFITHQGLKEYSSEEINSIKLWWEVRPSDPELEAEMYQRFLIFRDMNKVEAIKLVASHHAAQELTKIIEKDGAQMLQVNEGFARTWRRVGIALDRIGLLIDDRNRSEGLLYLRITDEFREKTQEDDGWFAGLFSSKKVTLKDRYLLSVNKENDQTLISIYETTGAKADADFVKVLLTDLKSYLN